MTSKLYVGSLPYSIENNELEALFAACGEVKSAKVIMDPATGQSKGFGFVEMSSAEEAKAAITTLNGTSHGGRSIVVSEAKPESKGGSRGAAGGRGGNERGGRGSSGGGWR
ncbi:MAG: RNA-binding protein [Gammaproteobacteria bacterium]|nr:RNA-binding protein [Gammaproteobacteria bacterium]